MFYATRQKYAIIMAPAIILTFTKRDMIAGYSVLKLKEKQDAPLFSWMREKMDRFFHRIKIWYLIKRGILVPISIKELFSNMRKYGFGNLWRNQIIVTCPYPLLKPWLWYRIFKRRKEFKKGCSVPLKFTWTFSTIR